VAFELLSAVPEFGEMITATTSHPTIEPRMPETACPYCARIMRWMNGNRAGNGWFECERCGTFDVHGWIPSSLPAAVSKSV
jgi:endogenous inhibitor of DNA gyrase (YacG/DUF329 family)